MNAHMVFGKVVPSLLDNVHLSHTKSKLGYFPKYHVCIHDSCMDGYFFAQYEPAICFLLMNYQRPWLQKIVSSHPPEGSTLNWQYILLHPRFDEFIPL